MLKQLKENKTDNNQMKNTKKFLNGMIYAFNILDNKDSQKLLYLNVKETKAPWIKTYTDLQLDVTGISELFDKIIKDMEVAL